MRWDFLLSWNVWERIDLGGDATYRHTTAFNPRQLLGFIMKRWFSPMNLSAINANLSSADLELLGVQYFSFVSA